MDVRTVDENTNKGSPRLRNLNMKCCVPGCKTQGYDSQVSYHRFPSAVQNMQKNKGPSNEQILQMWINNLQVKDHTKFSTVCSKHFKRDDFIFFKNNRKGKARWTCLLNTAVPTQNLPKSLSNTVKPKNIDADFEDTEIKKCFVHACHNISTTSNKFFFVVPRNHTRPIWFANGNVSNNLLNKRLHCCEDHFDIKKDTWSKNDNILILKDGVYPHKNLINNRNDPTKSQLLENKAVELNVFLMKNHKGEDCYYLIKGETTAGLDFMLANSIEITDQYYKPTIEGKNNMRINRCDVPSCSNAINCGKLFFKVPKQNTGPTNNWSQDAGITSTHLNAICCEDHFDLGIDTITSDGKVVSLKLGCVPHKNMGPTTNNIVLTEDEFEQMMVDEDETIFKIKSEAETESDSLITNSIIKLDPDIDIDDIDIDDNDLQYDYLNNSVKIEPTLSSVYQVYNKC